MATAYDIIIRPIITERAMSGAANKKYVFEVAKSSWPLTPRPSNSLKAWSDNGRRVTRHVYQNF